MKVKLNTVKNYIVKEKYMIFLSTVAYLFSLFQLCDDLGIIGVGMLALLISNKIRQRSDKRDFFIILLIFLVIGLTRLIKINVDICIKILFFVFSILLYSWISLGSKNLNTSIKGYIKLLAYSFFFSIIISCFLIAILSLLNFVSNELFNLEFSPASIFEIICFYYFLFFNYVYEKSKKDYIDSKDIKKEGNIVLILLDLLSVGVLIIFVYIAKVVFFNEYPVNVLGRLIPLFFAFAIIKILLVENYNKLKLEKIIWYASPILLFYYFNSYYKRIEHYGLTTNRLLMIFWGIFILLVSIYYFTIKNQDTKLKTIILTFLILMNLNLNLDNILVDKYKSKNKLLSSSRYKTINCINQFDFEKVKLYFRDENRSNIALYNDFVLQQDWSSTEIVKNSEIIFSSKYLGTSENNLNLLRADVVRVVFNNRDLSYSEFVEYLNKEIFDDSPNFKNAYFEIKLGETIVIIPLNYISLFYEEDLQKLQSLEVHFESVTIVLCRKMINRCT